MRQVRELVAHREGARTVLDDPCPDGGGSTYWRRLLRLAAAYGLVTIACIRSLRQAGYMLAHINDQNHIVRDRV